MTTSAAQVDGLRRGLRVALSEDGIAPESTRQWLLGRSLLRKVNQKNSPSGAQAHHGVIRRVQRSGSELQARLLLELVKRPLHLLQLPLRVVGESNGVIDGGVLPAFRLVRCSHTLPTSTENGVSSSSKNDQDAQPNYLIIIESSHFTPDIFQREEKFGILTGRSWRTYILPWASVCRRRLTRSRRLVDREPRPNRE